jgi:hypothetical protein
MSLVIAAAVLAVTAGWSGAEAALPIHFLVVATVVAVGQALSIISSRRLNPTLSDTVNP